MGAKPRQPPRPAPPTGGNGAVPATTGLGAIGVLALVLTGVAIAMFLLQTAADAIHAFGHDPYTDTPWYYTFWYELFCPCPLRRGSDHECADRTANHAFSS